MVRRALGETCGITRCTMPNSASLADSLFAALEFAASELPAAPPPADPPRAADCEFRLPVSCSVSVAGCADRVLDRFGRAIRTNAITTTAAIATQIGHFANSFCGLLVRSKSSAALG